MRVMVYRVEVKLSYGQLTVLLDYNIMKLNPTMLFQAWFNDVEIGSVVAIAVEVSVIYCCLPFLRFLSTYASSQQKDGWFNKLLVRKIEPTKESHSRMLSDKEVIYELQTHNLKPGTGPAYLKN